MNPWLKRAAFAGLPLALLALIPATSSAQANCGGEGQILCTIFSGKPPCQTNLKDIGGKCTHPDCGRNGQRPCGVLERLPSCDDSLVEAARVCGVKGECGGEGQRTCVLLDGKPACASANFIVEDARCIHPPCGRLGERACLAVLPVERVPSCDDNLVEVGGKCFAFRVCGAEGQRVCTVGERFPGCNDPSLIVQAGQCTKAGSHPAVAILTCGHMGERSCTGADRLFPACDAGLEAVPGCTGDCQGSPSMCANLQLRMTEPTTGWTAAPPVPGDDPLRGYGDVHVHMFSHLAFGGAVMVGKPYDRFEGVRRALFPDFATKLDVVSAAGTPMPRMICPFNIPDCGTTILHGDHVFIDDTMGLGTDDGTKTNFGAPIFNGWPTWRSTTHQQVYYKWLERAWRGGMRIMTMLAVNNEVACGTSKHVVGTKCGDSMPGIDAQLDAALEFQTWLDTQSGGPGGGFFQIAKSAEDAERIIREGKLAVVMGIEADTLFKCKQQNKCTPEFIASEIDRYYAKWHVRVIYPIHDFDGGFGGTAVWMGALNAGNVLIEGTDYKTAPCPPGISDYPPGAKVSTCNAKGLTPLGIALIQKLMQKGMIIDVDHMSARSIDETIALALPSKHPLNVGHGLFGELYVKSHKRHERMRTPAQLEALKQLGGLVSVMTQDDAGVDDDTCKHSSKSFALTYKYAVGKVGPVVFGSDFNGLAPHVGPRYGDDACGKDPVQRSTELRHAKLQYPFAIRGFGSFQKQVTGQRTFDFNNDGLAHIGLYPDLIADLALQGVDIEPLMKGAAAYVTMWKKSQHTYTPPPSTPPGGKGTLPPPPAPTGKGTLPPPPLPPGKVHGHGGLPGKP